MPAERADRLVQVPAELADLARVLLHRLLLPAVRHRPQQRDQRRRARRNDACCSTPNSMSDGSCSSAALKNISPGRNMTTNSGLDGTSRRSSPSPPSCDEVRAHLPRVIGEQRLARRFVRRLERAQVRVERRLRVDDDVLAAGQADDDVGPHAAIVVAVDRLLLLEIAVLDHAGELDDALQLQLAPAAADARPLERVDQAPRLGLQILAGRVERRDALQQLRAVLRRAAARRP